MKKAMQILMIGVFIIFVLSGCQRGSAQSDLPDVPGIDMNSGTIVANSDSHGGFHGDGERFVAISFSDPSIAERLIEDQAWKPLPLSKNITALIYGITTEEGREGPYVTDEDGKAEFPKIQNGYYYFIDKQNQNAARYDDTDVLDRDSFNFIIAIYDIDTDRLYYAELDT